MKRHSKIVAAAAITLACGLTGTAQAQQVNSPFAVLAGAGYARGGDTIIVGEYTDGSITNIKAGNGLEVYAGAAFRLGQYFAVQGDIGYQSSTGDAYNGELTFKRIPIEFLGYAYLNDSWRIGVGPRFDERVKLTGSGVASPVKADFDSAVGAMAEIEYLITPAFGVKFRAIKENFKVNGYSNTFNGNQAAIFVTLYY